MKKLITIALLLLSISSLSSSYEIIGYSNKGHFEQVYGIALINDSCDIHIVVGEDTYYIKYTPDSFRDRTDGLTESRGICNTVNCFIALNKGTLRVIEVRFKDGEVVMFYVK